MVENDPIKLRYSSVGWGVIFEAFQRIPRKTTMAYYSVLAVTPTTEN